MLVLVRVLKLEYWYLYVYLNPKYLYWYLYVYLNPKYLYWYLYKSKQTSCLLLDQCMSVAGCTCT